MILSLKGWMHGCIEMLLFMPLVILPGIFLSLEGKLPLWLVLLAVFYLAGTTSIVLLRITRRFWLLLYALAVTGLLSIAVFGNEVAGWVTWAIGLLAFYRGAYMAFRNAVDVYPEMFYWLGPIIYFVTSIFYFKLERLTPYIPLMFWFGLASLVVSMLMSNHVHLQWAALSRNKNQKAEEEQKLGAGLLWQNRFLLLFLLVLIMLVSLWKQMKDGIAWLYARLIGWLSTLFSSEEAELPPPESPSAPNLSAPPGLERGEPSAFFVWLEKAALFVFYIVILLASLALLYWLAKKAAAAARWLNRWLAARMNRQGLDLSESSGYTDEEEKLEGGLGHWRRSTADRLQAWFEQWRNREPKWEALRSDRDKARYLYRHYIWKQVEQGRPFDASWTPKEAMREWSGKGITDGDSIEPLIEAYEQARYGEQEPNGDLERLKQRLRIK
ncbi:DUF4129 domain-containing protein [Paenibacillus sp. 32O-W]|uniref:DUF4129 domain-containing protein n=1 Tax=Paenibacillus sp. 32O-W TaxID=1695218 RepID=UPI0021B677C1|nr:DUF4129 domain-containing protein [Paenibacillus sp. 32O-W]